MTTLPLTRFPQACRDFQFPLEFNTIPFRKSSSQEILRFKHVLYCHVGGTDPGQELNIRGVTGFRLENQHPGRCLCWPSVRRFWSSASISGLHAFASIASHRNALSLAIYRETPLARSFSLPTFSFFF